MEDNSLITTGPSDLSVPAQVNPDDLFRKIDTVKEEVLREPMPGMLAQMFNPDARGRALEIEKAKKGAIAARRKLIDGMGDLVQVYIDTHKEVLKNVAQGTVAATFARNRAMLYKASEASIVSFMNTYSTAVDEIHKVRNLTDEQKKERIEAAYERSVQAEKHANATFTSIVDTIAQQLRDAIRKIGDR